MLDNILQLSNTPILSFLGSDVLQLASTCKTTFQHFFDFINKNVQFRYPGYDQSFKLYNPQKIRVGGCFGGKASKPILNSTEPVVFPPSYYSLDWNKLPLMLTHLTFGPQFNSPVDNILPLSLSHLIFGSDSNHSLFNHPVDHLPPSLSLLYLGKNFEHPIDNLPSSLSHLTLRSYLNRSINNLPSSLTCLSLCSFSQPVTSLPSSLIHLQVPSLKFGETSFSIASLSKLHTFICGDEIPSNTIFSTSVQILRICNNLDSFPPKLTFLSICSSTPVQFPPSLVSLKLNNKSLELNDTHHRIEVITQLKHLSLIQAPIKLPLPSSLVKINCRLDRASFELIQHLFTLPNLSKINISIHYPLLCFNNSTPLSLPPKLTHLNIWHVADDGLEFINLINFHSSPLVSLKLYIEEYAELLCEYPPSLTMLDTSVTFKGQLPQSLQELTFNLPRNSSYILPHLPETLSFLDLTNCSLPSTFPPKLKELQIFHCNFKEYIPPLPETLQRLVLFAFSKCQIPILPHSLKILISHDNIISPGAFIPPYLEYVNVKNFKSKDLSKQSVTLQDSTFVNFLQ